jgi:hypothetical protein
MKFISNTEGKWDDDASEFISERIGVSGDEATGDRFSPPRRWLDLQMM